MHAAKKQDLLKKQKNKTMDAVKKQDLLNKQTWMQQRNKTC